MAYQNSEQAVINAIEISSRSFDYIVCPFELSPEILQRHHFVSVATWVTSNIILTARHVFNGLMCSDVKLLMEGRLYSLSLLEDGADYDQDYALLYVEQATGQRMPLTLLAPNEGTFFGCPIFSEFGEYDTGIAQVPFSMHHILQFESGLKVLPGASGAPYINARGQIFGLHLSGYEEHSMWPGIVTGMTLRQILDNLPPGRTWLEAVCYNQYTLSFAWFYKKPIYFFDDDFIKTLPSIGQLEHRARLEAFGADNDGLESLTGSQVLLRYFLKDKARLKDTLLAPFSKQCKKFLAGIKNNPPLNYFTYRDEHAFDHHKPSQDICKLFKAIEYWEVLIHRPINNDLKNTKHEWVPLNKKRIKGKKDPKEVAAIQMGHKMGATDYWAYGAGTKDAPANGWLKNERISTMSPTKYNTAKKRADKIHQLEERYKGYRVPGHQMYDKPPYPTKKFMFEPWNFHFQWWRINQRDGTLAGKKTPYHKFTPPGYKWVDRAKPGSKRADYYLEKI